MIFSVSLSSSFDDHDILISFVWVFASVLFFKLSEVMRMRKFVLFCFFVFFKGLTIQGNFGCAFEHLLIVSSFIAFFLVLFCKTVFYVLYLNNVTVFSASRDQMLSNDSVATATENASRLGYKHVCVNYLHVASHDYQEVIQHTHTHIHTLTHSQNRSIFSLA